MSQPSARTPPSLAGAHALSRPWPPLLSPDHANWLTFRQISSTEAPEVHRAHPCRRSPGPISSAGSRGRGSPECRILRRRRPAVRPLHDPVPQYRPRAQRGRLPQALLAAPQISRQRGPRDPPSVPHADPLGFVLNSSAPAGAPARGSSSPTSPSVTRARVSQALRPGTIPPLVLPQSCHPGPSACGCPGHGHASQRDVPPPACLGARCSRGTSSSSTTPAMALALRWARTSGPRWTAIPPSWESSAEQMGFVFALLHAKQCDPELFAAAGRADPVSDPACSTPTTGRWWRPRRPAAPDRSLQSLPCLAVGIHRPISPATGLDPGGSRCSPASCHAERPTSQRPTPAPPCGTSRAHRPRRRPRPSPAPGRRCAHRIQVRAVGGTAAMASTGAAATASSHAGSNSNQFLPA